MTPKSQLRKTLATFVDIITMLILYVIGWVNNAANAANKFYQKFGIRGDIESDLARRIKTDIPTPKTKEDFKKGLNNFIQANKLDKFFPASDHPLLETLVSKAVELQNDDTSVLGQSNKTEDLVKVGLYQPIIYCDDSSSMSATETNDNVTRLENQQDIVQRVASICCKLVPEDLGVHLRFINWNPPNADNLRMRDVNDIMKRVAADGATMIGTRLREKILDPFVYQTDMIRPIFISIVTDGEPTFEQRDKLKREILLCRKHLRSKGLPERAVVFQLSQIGSCLDSKIFLDDLAKDPSLKGALYITSEQLDSRFTELRGNDRALEAWLFQTLLIPIIGDRNC